jgi:hypothetical protein
MNPVFLPTRQRSLKPGLSAIKKINQYHPGASRSTELRESIPGSWIYSETESGKVWDDLERPPEGESLRDHSKDERKPVS